LFPTQGYPEYFAPTYIVYKVGAVYRAKASAESGLPSFSGTDFSTVIQDAIDALPDEGGHIFIKKGDYRITKTIKIHRSYVQISGEGAATVLKAESGYEAIRLLEIGDGVTTYGDIAIRNLMITAVNQKTSEAAIAMNKCFKVLIEWVLIRKQYRAILIRNTTEVWILNLDIRDTTENGITIDNDLGAGYDWYIANVVMDNPAVTNTGAGIYWDGGETLVVHGADIIRFEHPVVITAQSGRKSRWGYFTNCVMDSAGDNCLKVTNSGTGKVIGITFVNCWWGSADNYGVLIERPGTGEVEGIRFVGGKCMNNGLAGFRLTGGSDVHILGCDIISNSADAANVRSGVEVAAGVSDFSIIDCRITNGYDHGATQKYGILIDPGPSDNYVIEGNDLRGNVTGALSDGGTGVNKTIRNNLGHLDVVKSGTASVTIPTGGGSVPVSVTIAELSKIYYVAEVRINTDPKVNEVYVPQGITVTGNVVGLTVSAAVGTTVYVEVFAYGLP